MTKLHLLSNAHYYFGHMPGPKALMFIVNCSLLILKYKIQDILISDQVFLNVIHVMCHVHKFVYFIDIKKLWMKNLYQQKSLLKNAIG